MPHAQPVIVLELLQQVVVCKVWAAPWFSIEERELDFAAERLIKSKISGELITKSFD